MLDQIIEPFRGALSGIVVRHLHYENAVCELKRLIKNSEYEGGRIIPVLGPTRSGKTELAKDLKTLVETPQSDMRSLILPSDVVLGRLPARPSERDYYGSCLRGMGFDYAERERPAQIRDRLFRLIREHDVKTLIIDEVNHCAETLTRHSQRQAADHFKTIVDETSATLILCGLPMFDSVIESNEQFAARCLKTIRLNPYWWTVNEDREAFCDAVFSIFDCLEEAGIELAFEQEDIARRMYGLTGGRIPIVLEILRAPFAQNQRLSKITFSSLKRAAYDTGLEAISPESFLESDPPSDTDLVRSYMKVMADAGVYVEPATAHELALKSGI